MIETITLKKPISVICPVGRGQLSGVRNLETQAPFFEVALGWNQREWFPYYEVQYDSEYATLSINWLEAQPLTVTLEHFPDLQSAEVIWRRNASDSAAQTTWLMNFAQMHYSLHSERSLPTYMLLTLSLTTQPQRPLTYATFSTFTEAYRRYATIDVERAAISPPVMGIDLLLRQPRRFRKRGEISAWCLQYGSEHLHRCTQHFENEDHLIAVA